MNEFQDHNEAFELGMQDKGNRRYDEDKSFQLMWECRGRQWWDANRRLM